jgi:hypothetical protein
MSKDKKEVSFDDLVEVIKKCHQLVLEISHAQQSGRDWYTKGDSGIFQIIYHHREKAGKAIESVSSAIYPEIT